MEIRVVKFSYKIPSPPGSEVEFVRDMDGNEYRRADREGEYWYNTQTPRVRGTYAWHDLLWQRGPVTHD